MEVTAVTTAYVYVGVKGSRNLDTGIRKSVWGWKPDVIVGTDYHPVLQSLKEGDRLCLGHLGLGRIQASEAQSRTVPTLVVARLTGGLYQDAEKVWDDEDGKTSYPYRVPLEIEETRYDVTSDDIGPEGIEALRMSAIRNGTPELPGSRESVMERVLEEVLEEYGGEPLDEEDPEDSANLDLPSALDVPSYTLARREQKIVRARKLDGRTEVPCDLCQLLLPKRLVHTAHIKRRSRSLHHERRDLNNVMFACVLGCDSLFEHGYVYVASDGSIRPSDAVRASADLSTAVGRVGTRCLAYSDASAPYFAWHRENIANVKGR
ncbi:hypothetical protein ACIBFB_11285 [Nocardiopsis sp. NPDC050513]|uniref:hypothetical protein n=1 Tax=Nocardiopsis sp. NPDC050513 TaxID=3364338 RepID=UPI0037B111CA